MSALVPGMTRVGQRWRCRVTTGAMLEDSHGTATATVTPATPSKSLHAGSGVSAAVEAASRATLGAPLSFGTRPRTAKATSREAF
jgi:hypothetical protein